MKTPAILLVLMFPLVVSAQSNVSIKAFIEDFDAGGVSVGHYTMANEWVKFGMEVGYHQNEYHHLNVGFFPTLHHWNFNLHSGFKVGSLIGDNNYDLTIPVGAGYTAFDRLEIGYRHNFMMLKVNDEYLYYGQFYLGLNL